MNVQNLREKFNQPVNGTLTSPGTSFGVNKPKEKSENPVTKLPRSFVGHTKSLPAQQNAPPEPVAPALYRAQLRDSKSLSPDRPISPSVPKGNKTIANGEIEGRPKAFKSVEQAQESVILRKWGKTSASPEPVGNAENHLLKSKKCVSNFVTQLTTKENEKDDNSIDNRLSDGNEKLLKNVRESNVNHFNHDKSNNAHHSNGIGIRNNSSFLHSSKNNNSTFGTRIKMNNNTDVNSDSSFNSYSSVKDSAKGTETKEKGVRKEEPEFTKVQLSKGKNTINMHLKRNENCTINQYKAGQM